MTSSLIPRLEAGNGSDRELDGDLWLALDPETAMAKCGFKGMKYAGRIHTKAEKAAHIKWSASNFSPPYTSSLDASLALVERMLPGWQWSVHKQLKGSFIGFVWNWDRKPQAEEEGKAQSPPRALLIALLKALESSK